MQIQGNVPKPAGPEARPSACPARPDRLPSGKRVQRYALMRNGQTKQGTFFEENQGRLENTLSHRTIHGENHPGKRRKGRKRTHLLYYIYARKTKGTGAEGQKKVPCSHSKDKVIHLKLSINKSLTYKNQLFQPLTCKFYSFLISCH